MKILIATDGSAHAATAMTSAARLLVHRNNHFDTMLVAPPPPESLRGGELDRYRARMKAEADQRLETAGRALGREGIEAGRIVEWGSPADTLLGRAVDYDVVVAGVSHRGERAGPGLGPVASRLLDRAAATILIGRALGNDKAFRILLAVDGSTASANAVETLRSGFKLADSEITVMHVIEKPWLRLGIAEDTPDANGSEREELEELFGAELGSEAGEIVDAARSRFSGLGAGTEALIVDGDPAHEILRQAEIGEYDLAVLGATGASDLKHTLLGSVSFRLASNAPCSVAVIR